MFVCSSSTSASIKSYVLLPCVLPEATATHTCSHVHICTHVDTLSRAKHSWDGRIQSGLSDWALGAKVICHKGREWIAFYWLPCVFRLPILFLIIHLPWASEL